MRYLLTKRQIRDLMSFLVTLREEEEEEPAGDRPQDGPA